MSFPNNLDPYNFFRQLFGGSSSSGERKGREGRGDFLEVAEDGTLMICLENWMK